MRAGPPTDVADEDTQQQLDELWPHLEAQRRIRTAHQRRRDALQEQAARLGAETPVHITQEISDLIRKLRDADTRIREIEAKIVHLETAPAPETVLIIPDQAPYIPVLAPAAVDERLRAQDRALEWMRETITELRRLAEFAQQTNADTRELTELAREESREWRKHETMARQEGVRNHQGEHRTLRIILIGGAVVLLVVAIGLVLILVKVF